MTGKVANLPSPTIPWVQANGTPSPEFQRFMTLFAKGNFGPFPQALNDAKAAQIGVPVGGVYQNPTNGILFGRMV